MSNVRRIAGENLPIISSPATLRRVLFAINESGGLPCLVVNSDGQVVEFLTDGDVRRLLLSGHPIDKTLSVNSKPFTYVGPNTTSSKVMGLLEAAKISHLPELGPHKEPVALWVRKDRTLSESCEVPVLILAGGKGSRLLPLTLSRPKPLIKVGDVTLLDRALAKCVSDGFRDFYMSVNYLKQQVIDHLEKSVSSAHSMTFVEEDTPLGTAGPVGLLPPESLGDLLVVNADVIHNVDLRKMIEAHQESEAVMTVAVRLHQTTIPFGVVEIEDTQIVRITEKPTLNFPVNAGMYVLSQQVRDLVPQDVPLDMPDLIEIVIDRGLPVFSFLAHEYWLDVGTHESLAIAESEIDQWNLESS